MRGHVLEVLVPGLREARRPDDARETVAVHRIVATRDPLTGLLNARACAAVGKSVLAWALRHQECVSIVDLVVGPASSNDALALEISEVVKSMLGDGDVAARASGEEFVVLLADADGDRAAGFLTELGTRLGSLAGAPATGGWCSMGAATAAADVAEDYEALLARARLQSDPSGPRRAGRAGAAARLRHGLSLVPFVRGPLEAFRRAHRN